ncbi:hypothetical protein HYC85_012882 [Camellia sinensis]|uniref:C2H2-type domain-containing protein n=1 Tax=Camellia sinensis TaxID=4442 RepID=A0A7J7HDR4_CAMSI|nr:hypothetical protein HYC85_012882 [Camellia sinensis]
MQERWRSKSTKTLLDWNKDLAKEPDMYGWTPLHYAARFGHVERAKQLLDMDKSIAYVITDKDGKKTALHVAGSQGHVGVMKELRSQCPDCWEMVNDKGQNILHVAVHNENKKVVKFILENSQLSSLINHKDIDGNTPLHLAATALHSNRLIYDKRADRMAFNKENQTPLDITTHYENVTLVTQIHRFRSSTATTIFTREVARFTDSSISQIHRFKSHRFIDFRSRFIFDFISARFRCFSLDFEAPPPPPPPSTPARLPSKLPTFKESLTTTSNQINNWGRHRPQKPNPVNFHDEFAPDVTILFLKSLCISGWIRFFWTMWLATKKSVGLAKHSLTVTGSVLSAYSSAQHVRSRHEA